MCKVLVVAGVKPEHDALLWKFVQTAAEPMVETDKDGYGYMAISHGGRMFGEKWFSPKHRFKMRDDISDEAKIYRKAFGKCVSLTSHYKALGESKAWEDTTATVIAHARFATCGKELENVHPFVRDDVALIHNGIIQNTDEHAKCVSSCDSESILTCYLDGKIKTDPSAFQKEVADKLEGSYACAVLTPEVLDVFRNMGSTLYVARVAKMEAWVFATTKEIIYKGAGGIKSKVGPVVELNAGSFVRLNPLTGEVMMTQEFTSSYTRWVTRKTYFPSAVQQEISAIPDPNPKEDEFPNADDQAAWDMLAKEEETKLAREAGFDTERFEREMGQGG